MAGTWRHVQNEYPLQGVVIYIYIYKFYYMISMIGFRVGIRYTTVHLQYLLYKLRVALLEL